MTMLIIVLLCGISMFLLPTCAPIWER